LFPAAPLSTEIFLTRSQRSGAEETRVQCLNALGVCFYSAGETAQKKLLARRTLSARLRSWSYLCAPAHCRGAAAGPSKALSEQDAWQRQDAEDQPHAGSRRGEVSLGRRRPGTEALLHPQQQDFCERKRPGAASLAERGYGSTVEALPCCWLNSCCAQLPMA